MDKISIHPPLKAIRRYCLECVGNQRKEVALCTRQHCPLYPYRFGVRPETARKMGKNVDPDVVDGDPSQKPCAQCQFLKVKTVSKGISQADPAA